MGAASRLDPRRHGIEGGTDDWAVGGSMAGVAALVGIAVVLATPAASQAQVYFNDAGASGPVEPTAFAPASPCCLTEYMRDLTWQSWGGAEATATGAVALGRVEPSGAEALSPATVTLSGLSSCGGQPVYSSYEIRVASGVTPGVDWSRARTGTFACRFSAENYRPSSFDARGDCELSPPDERAWTPEIPRLWQPGFCRMQWTGFDTGPTAIGKGVMRTGLEQFGAEVRLSGLEWCQEGIGDAIAYTSLSMTIYGKGESENNGELGPDDTLTVANANRLRDNIGRPGLKARSYRYRGSITRGCVGLDG